MITRLLQAAREKAENIAKTVQRAYENYKCEHAKEPMTVEEKMDCNARRFARDATDLSLILKMFNEAHNQKRLPTFP